MSTVTINLPNGCHLASIRPGDQAAYVAHPNEPELHRYTGHLPYPYTAADAEWWVSYRAEPGQAGAPETLFALRPKPIVGWLA